MKNDKKTSDESAKKKPRVDTFLNIPETCEPMNVDSTETPEPANFSTKLLFGTIQCRDYRTLIEDCCLTTYQVNFLNLKSEPKINRKKNQPLSVEPKKTVMLVKRPRNGRKPSTRANLNEMEQLYNKYFSKSVQDTIVTIANILNIMTISNRHLKTQMDESIKIQNEVVKLTVRHNAYRAHEEHTEILNAKLKKYFSRVVNTFEKTDIKATFRLFFLSCLTVLRVLDNSKLKKGSLIKNVVLLLWNSLTNSNYNNSQLFIILQSKTFIHECVDLMASIKDRWDIDPGITDRMALLFVSTVDSKKYFEAVVDAISHNSNQDLGILIDYASVQYSMYSKLKNPIAIGNSAYKIPGTASQTIQQCAIREKPAGSVNIPINEYKYQANSNKAVSSKSSSESLTPSTSNRPFVLVTSSETTSTTCFAKNCNNLATIMCSSCTTTYYCSNDCQRKDWFDNHSQNCDKPLLTI